MVNILVVDDEQDIADLLELYLKNEGYQVFKFYSSENIMDFLSNHRIDLALLDVMMPNIDGFKLCREIRKQYTFPILFLTAKIDEDDKILGFSSGADDYITKPFRAADLIARVKSNIRRYKVYSNQVIEDDEISFREIYINKKTHEMHFKGKKINLTPIEFSIMWDLCKNKGKVVTNDDLFKSVWKDKYYNKENNTIMVHIKHIREKMNDCGDSPEYITTVWGVGYEIKET